MLEPATSTPEVSVARYYSSKLAQHGATPVGVDWSDATSQVLRFDRLLELVKVQAFSINDLGCGYGALLGHLDKRWSRDSVSYCGLDLSPAMIASAKAMWRDRPDASFFVAPYRMRVADYSVASGVFNVNLEQPLGRWEDFVGRTLVDMVRASRLGVAVNFMRSLSTAGACPSPLYRTSPRRWRNFFEEMLGWQTRISQGYGLGEFTLLATRRQ